jgi:hypothetical protein
MSWCAVFDQHVTALLTCLCRYLRAIPDIRYHSFAQWRARSRILHLSKHVQDWMASGLQHLLADGCRSGASRGSRLLRGAEFAFT